MDALGDETGLLPTGWTPTDAHGHGLEIYGSGGWGFKSLWACHTPAPNPST
jgi:hypothetical protein